MGYLRKSDLVARLDKTLKEYNRKGRRDSFLKTEYLYVKLKQIIYKFFFFH
jgi:hypothetical protein